MFGRRGGTTEELPEPGAARGGRIVTVWGPSGAPGRSTVAAALAGALVGRGRVALIDADLLRGALAVLLGADVGGNVASASRFPAPPGDPCPPDHLCTHRAGFALLPGVPGPAQGVTVEPADLAALLERLRLAYDLVVVDVGWGLPPHNHGLGHLAALVAADLVVAVAAATRLGISDLLLQYDALGMHLASGGSPAVWCVLNRGHGPGMESMHRRITQDLGLRVVSYIPHDCRAVARAEEKRLPLTIAGRESPASAALWAVAERVWRTPPRPRTHGGGADAATP